MQIEGLGYHGLRRALASGIELLICNRSEAKQLTGEDDPPRQLEALRFRGSVRIAVVTAGAEGIFALDDAGLHSVPAFIDPGRPVADDTGAGDAAQAAIVDALLRGHCLDLALWAGVRQGFEACTAVGATTHLLTGDEMCSYLAQTASSVKERLTVPPIAQCAT